MGYATTQVENRLFDGTNLLDGLILFFFMPVMAMIYGSSLIRDEIEDKSITQVVTSPLNRIVTYSGYYIGLSISVSIIMLIILTSGFLTFFGIMGLNDSGEIYGSMAVMVIIGSFVYSSLFIMISVLIGHPIYFGLIYAFIWEGFIGSIPGSLQYLTVKHFVRSLGTDWIDYGIIADYNATSPGNSAAILVIFIIVLIVLGAILFKEKEFT
jgi:ABC-2 type transport system permease protein